MSLFPGQAQLAPDRSLERDVQAIMSAHDDNPACDSPLGPSLAGETGRFDSGVTSESPSAVRALERCTWSLLFHQADTLELLEEALALDPGLALGHIVRGFQLRLLARAEFGAPIAQAIAAAKRSVAVTGGNAREHLLVRALDAWHAGQASRCLETLRVACETHPRCLLSMKLLHAVSLMYGKLELSRRALERSLAELEARTQNHGVVLGCYAFALHETGSPAQAQEAAMDALEISRGDVWAFHALLHALSTQQRFTDASTLLRRCGERFAKCNNFRAHLVWHQALLATARGDYDEALELHDKELERARVASDSADYRDLANCISLLVRLERAGVDVGARYEELADACAAQAGNHRLAFADAHYLLGLLRSGRTAQAHGFIAGLRAQLVERCDEDALVYARTGVPVLEGLSALHRGTPERTLAPFAALSAAELSELGGSHMQRELFLQLSQDAHQVWHRSTSKRATLPASQGKTKA